MHANQHQQRVNHSMSIDSSGISLSKMTQKKSPFYKHQDPFKLNYYARFSPNRKQIDKNLNHDALGGTSPLSPKTQRSSASSRKSSKSIMTKIQKDQPSINHRQQFQLIDQNVLLSVNQKHQERGEIFIDDSDYSSEDDINQNILKGNQSETKNYAKQDKFILPSFAIDYPIYQNHKESSSSQESSSFDRFIDPSSSQDNDIPFFAIKKPGGGQMLIQDEDSQNQDNDQVSRFNIEDRFGILDGSEKKILQLAKSIGAYKQQRSSNDIKKQIQSQNNSFSLDSDLSLIEQKWNSYFQTDQDSLTSRSEVLNQPFLSQNVCEKLFDNKNQNSKQRKMSSSSEQELPSFSNPDHSNYKITPLESQRSSALSQEIPSFNKHQANTNPQTKQFKRQFTFGNQLNTMFVKGLQQKQTQSHQIQPLFKKLMPKNVIQTFISKKDKTKLNQNQTKQKNVLSNSRIVKPQTEQLSRSIKTKLKLSANQKINPSQFHPNEDQDLSQSKSFVQQNIKNCEILIIDEPSSPEQKVHKIQSPRKQILQKSKRKDYPATKQSEKARKRALWQQTLKQMLEKEIKQKQTKTNSQKNEDNQHYEEKQQDKTEQKNDERLNEISHEMLNETQNKDLKVKFEEIPYKTQKFIEQSSYSKIYSEKKLYKSRKGSYNDKAKISQSQHQSSQQESLSLKDKQNSRPKSQDCQSFTTATQQTGQNVQIYPHYFFRNISNSTEEVQNLKKYLQRIDDSPVSKKSLTKKISNFELHESFESQGNQKDSINDSHVSISVEQLQQVTHQKQNLAQIVPKLIQNQENPKTNQLQQSQTHIQFMQISPMKPNLETLNKINQNQTQFQFLNEKLLQLKTISQNATQQTKTFNFTKSLSMLENLMLNSSDEFTKIYQKIYSQVYQQQLKYQNKLQKQQFLLKIMDMFVQGEQQNINCKDFLINQEHNSNKSQKSSVHQDDPSKSKEEQTQIFINKHIILALVRNLASKQSQFQIQQSYSNKMNQ